MLQRMWRSVATEAGKQAVAKWFDKYVFEFMRHDLDVSLKGGANFLVALGLVCWSETLGAIAMGTINQRHGTKENFEKFIEYMDQEYRDLNEKLEDAGGLYDVVRNGLVHKYFPKIEATLWRRGDVSVGILGDEPTKRLDVVLERWVKDFFAAAEKLRDATVANPPPETVRYAERFTGPQPLFENVSGGWRPPSPPGPQYPRDYGTRM